MNTNDSPIFETDLYNSGENVADDRGGGGDGLETILGRIQINEKAIDEAVS